MICSGKTAFHIFVDNEEGKVLILNSLFSSWQKGYSHGFTMVARFHFLFLMYLFFLLIFYVSMWRITAPTFIARVLFEQKKVQQDLSAYCLWFGPLNIVYGVFPFSRNFKFPFSLHVPFLHVKVMLFTFKWRDRSFQLGRRGVRARYTKEWLACVVWARSTVFWASDM